MPNRRATAPKLSPLIVSLAYDGLGTFEFGITTEIFGLARPELEPNWYRFAVAAAEPGPLRAIGGIRVMVDGGLDLIAEADTIIVPGWRGTLDEPPPADLLDALRLAHGRGARLVSICSGVFVLAATGLLAGKRVTTHWRLAGQLAAAYPDIKVEPDVLYIDEGSVLTSAGSAAGIDLCLYIVRRDFGAQIANNVARRLVVPPHREGGQAQFIERPMPRAREGARLGPLLDSMRGRLEEELTIRDLACEAGMSVRTFLRRFEAATGMTPGEWLLGARLQRARELLEANNSSIDDIAVTCGFGSAATMRHHFRTKLGSSPAAYRKTFGRI
jgi:AraC family transcriptional activator FtrA